MSNNIIVQPKDYQIANEEISNSSTIPSYFGYTNSGGAWVIVEIIENDGTYKYTRGNGNYSGEWDDRTSLVYDYLPNKYFDKDILLALIKTGIPVKTLGKVLSVQNPLPTDGDSVYLKDIDTTRSILNGFSGSITDLFDNANSLIIESSLINPKSYTVYFNRPITTSEITIAAGQIGNFSNAKLYLYDIAGNELLSIDNSTDDTKYTKYVFNNVPQTFIGYKIEFHTEDTISIAFNYIHKSIDVQANLKALSIDTGLLEDIGSLNGALAVTTKTELLTEDRISGTDTGSIIGSSNNIGTTFQIISPQLYVQPSVETAMEIVSNDANDILGGSGIEKVVVVYFDKSIPWNRFSLTIDMNGVTPVALINTNTYRIQSMTAIGGVTDGTVTLQNIGGGTTYGSIEENNSIMERCVFYVRAGYRAVISDILLGCTTNGGVKWRLFATNETPDGITTPIGQLSISSADDTFGHPLRVGFSLENPDGGRFAVGAAGIALIANQNGTVSFRIYEELI